MTATDITGRSVLLTGATGNLGRAAVAAFRAAGARIAVMGRDLGRLEASYPDADGMAVRVAADPADETSIERAVAAVAAAYGRIDILCNIAGGFHAGEPVHETPDAGWQSMLEANTFSAIRLARAVVPRMIAARSGNIVNVSAASSARGQPGMAAYIVSKDAIVRITESMAAELRRHNIAVCCVMPTTIDTPDNRAAMPNADTSLWTPPEAIAQVMVFLASDAAVVLSGCAIPINGRPRSA